MRELVRQIQELRKEKNLNVDDRIEISLKTDQRTGRLTRGRVADILTSSSTHPHGIKVRLEDGQVGRVQNIISK